MSHHIYTTDGFVLESRPSGEADLFFTIFTCRLGVIGAFARSIRLERSKLRYNLQDFSWSQVSLVRGRDMWRITTARIKENFSHEYRGDKKVLGVIVSIFGLLRRLLAGEEKNEALYFILQDAFEFLKSRTWNAELKLFETLLVLKILANLGYMGNTAELKHFVDSPWADNTLSSFAPHAKKALLEINNSLRQTQL